MHIKIKPETLGYEAPPVLEGLAVLSDIIEILFLRKQLCKVWL